MSFSTSGSVLKIWTARSSLISGELLGGVPLLTQAPYDRILAMETEPGVVVESMDIADCDGRLELRQLELPSEEMAGRLSHYYASVVAKNDIWLGNVMIRPEADYNCHDMADALVFGTPPQGHKAAHRRVQANRSEYRPIPASQWRAGQRGIVVQELLQDTDEHVVTHSFVNLGRLCINVWDVGGTLGLTTLGDIATEFSHNGQPGVLMAHFSSTTPSLSS